MRCRYMQLSLQNKILLLSIPLIVVVLCISIFFSFHFSKTAVEKLANQQIESHLKQLKGHIERLLADIMGDVEENSQNENIISVLLDPDNTEIVLKTNQLLRTLKDASELVHVAVVDLNGNTVATSNEGKIGTFYGDRDYFQRAVRGETAVSKVLESRVIGKPVIVVAAPVKSGESIVGITFETVNLGEFTDKYVDPVKIGEKGFAFIVENDGVYVAHPDKPKILKESVAETDFGKKILNQKKGVLEYGVEGRPMLAHLRETAINHWIIAVQIEKSDIFAPIYTIRNRNIGIAATLVVILSLILWRIVKTVNTPIRRISRGLSDNAQQLSLESQAISDSAQALAERTSEQAASIQQTSASLEQMSALTRQSSKNTDHAKTIITQIAKMIDSTNVSMTKLSDSMHRISVASENTSKIVKSIDEISFQTNLLSLNAAIEAARAGDSGAGFAVVADEVRNLALRAANAAKNTAELIENTIGLVQNGVDIVAGTSKAFDDLFHSAETIVDLVYEIASVSDEQSRGFEQINIAVSEIDKVVQQNAASAEETASVSQILNEQASFLKTYIDELGTLVDGQNGRQNGSASMLTSHRREDGNESPKNDISLDIDR